MKKLVWILSLLTLVTGCSFVQIEDESFPEIVDSILKENFELKNVSLEGYSYYLPKGVILKQSNTYNSILYYNHKKMYLYVDAVSYYHKIENNYQKTDNNYFAMEINQNGKQGYLEITQIGDHYFVEFMYHYAKIEANVSEGELKKTVTTMAYILNSVNYHDNVLNTIIGENSLNYNEETFNIFKPKREDGAFLKYEELYPYDSSIDDDEDTIDLEEQAE